MSTTRATKRPNAKSAPAKVRQVRPTSARAAPEKTRTLGKNAEAKPPRENLGNAGKGRLKGVPNAITKTAREIFSAFVEGNASKLQELFDRVARKSPAKALSIYAKLAEFVVPKLQRTELSGQLTHGVFTGEVLTISDPIEAMRAYQEIILSSRDPASVNLVSTGWQPPPALAIAPRPEAAPERPSRHESAQENAESVAPAPETNVLVLEPTHQGEHQPIQDSKCAWCRKLWVSTRDAAEDEKLRHLIPPRVIT